MDPVRIQRELLQRREQLQDDFAFVARCNVGGEFMAEADIARLKAIGRQICQWHFDDRLGLSAAEMLRLSTVPWIAGSHHEKLDGTGYPRRRKAPELTLADRVMTLADIFEALTAADRPYKPPKTLSESLKTMTHMVRERHIDAEVFRFFLTSGVWRDYAERFLTPAQRDEVNVEAILASLG